jgi:hypothetical protein
MKTFFAAFVLCVVVSNADADVLTLTIGSDVVEITCIGTFVKTTIGYDCTPLPLSDVDMIIKPPLTSKITRRRGNTTKRVDVTVDKDTTIKINGVAK